MSVCSDKLTVISRRMDLLESNLKLSSVGSSKDSMDKSDQDNARSDAQRIKRRMLKEVS
jgi:hypothetical protein